MKEMMFDLETWGTLPGCALRSIGAVIFDGDDNDSFIKATFYQNIDINSCVVAGLEIDPHTIEWWRHQPPEAFDAFQSPPQQPLTEVVDAFHDWLRGHSPETVWSHGINFDEPIWRYAANAVGRVVPWHHRATRDTRTLFALSGFDLSSVHNSIKHHALEDAKAQALAVQLALHQLRRPSP